MVKLAKLIADWMNFLFSGAFVGCAIYFFEAGYKWLQQSFNLFAKGFNFVILLIIVATVTIFHKLFPLKTEKETKRKAATRGTRRKK